MRMLSKLRSLWGHNVNHVVKNGAWKERCLQGEAGEHKEVAPEARSELEGGSDV